MNAHQKVAFGVVVVLVLALLARDNLTMLIVLALLVALLTLPTTWKLIFLSLQTICLLISGVGHGIGDIADAVISWTEDKRRRLSSPRRKTSRVPEWDELKAGQPDTASSFLDGALEHQNT